ncbi:MAG: hypothetical protein K8U57_27750 [Planctomycetes bacterium]|nr:hypothetical protein [Planctomycetota bacterium]
MSTNGLYVRRNLTSASAAALVEWATSQGFANLVPEHELHATIVYSRKPTFLQPNDGTVTAPGDGRSVERLGDKGAVVLRFVSPELDARWHEARQIGASSDYDAFTPHVTFTYDAADVDLAAVAPFTGELVFGPEIHEPITENWAEEKGLIAQSVTLHAMALNVPETPGHPNKLPFKGVLTRIDEPSDSPPGGSNGKRVLLTRAAVERALPTLLGMPVDARDNMSGHDVRAKIGTITAATIEGNAIHIEGFLFAADFPQEVRRIQSERDDLGFSWEIQNIFVEDTTADPLVITGCTFTGAAILYKDKAAYKTTSLAAQAEENDMTKEILDAIAKLGEQVGTVTTAVESVTGRLEKIEASQAETTTAMQAGKEVLAKVEPHAAALEGIAAAMEKDGIGGHTRMGHVKACRLMAEHLRAAAATATLADAWPGFDGFHAAAEVKTETKVNVGESAEVKALKDQVAGLTTKIADMQASATRKAEPAERKTLTPQITALLARNGITVPADGSAKLAVADLDKAFASSSLEPIKRMEVKNALSKAGLLAA